MKKYWMVEDEQIILRLAVLSQKSLPYTVPTMRRMRRLSTLLALRNT